MPAAQILPCSSAHNSIQCHDRVSIIAIKLRHGPKISGTAPRRSSSNRSRSRSSSSSSSSSSRSTTVMVKAVSATDGAAAQVLPNPNYTHRTSAEERVYDVVLKQAALLAKRARGHGSTLGGALIVPDVGDADADDAVSAIAAPRSVDPVSDLSRRVLDDAYARCGEVCAEYAKTFSLGTMLMTPERRRAIWAIYVWCRRTDELVDGPNSSHITPAALDRWERRLEDVFEGKPYDMLDAALADAVTKFPIDIQPFRDMIDGMRLDLVKARYETFDELYLYCYYVAGTVGLMSVPVMGIAPDSRASTESVYSSALALGIANQLTNILRDVGEDARRGRIYLPKDELAQFGLSEEDIFAGKVTDRWRAFMKNQIERARMFFDEAEKGVVELDKDSRWPVWAALILYRQILDSIEANDYNNFTMRAYVGKWKKLLSLPVAYGRALLSPSQARRSFKNPM